MPQARRCSADKKSRSFLILLSFPKAFRRRHLIFLFSILPKQQACPLFLCIFHSKSYSSFSIIFSFALARCKSRRTCCQQSACQNYTYYFFHSSFLLFYNCFLVFVFSFLRSSLIEQLTKGKCCSFFKKILNPENICPRGQKLSGFHIKIIGEFAANPHPSCCPLRYIFLYYIPNRKVLL